MEKKVTLRVPVKIGGVEVTEIEIRPSTIGDEEDAVTSASAVGRDKNPLTTEMFILSSVTQIPYETLRKMNTPDYLLLRKALNDLNGMNTSEDKEENPTT